MSAQPVPDATHFEPGSDTLPPALESAILESDNPILLLVAPDTGDAAVRTAIGLADARARAGHETVLADAATRAPRLHEVLDVENLEGLADVFLFGASLDRVRVRPATRAFDFVPVGAYVPDPRAMLESTRWSQLARSLEGEGARLLVFVPAETPGLGMLSKRVGQAVLLADARNVDRTAAKLDQACEILAVVEPVSPFAPGRLAAEAGHAEAPEAATIFDAPELTEPVVFRSDRERRRVVSPILLILLLAALCAAGWFAYQEYFTAEPDLPAANTAPVSAPAPVRGEPVETPIPISVAVEAHQDLESAQERMATLRQAEPDIGFYLAPVAVRGVVYYRLLAGPAADQAAGERLMARLVEGQYKTAADPWAIRPTELAFHLGEFDTREAAAARVDSLATSGVPAYVVPIRYQQGPPRYRVYGGAYESETEAEVMQEMLEENGVEARLIPRTGEPIAEGS